MFCIIQKKHENIRFYQTLYFKILLLFSCGLLLLLILTFVLFRISTNFIVDKSFSAIKQQTEYAFQTFEESLTGVKESIDTLGYDNDMIQLTYAYRYSDKYQQYLRINAIYSKLQNIQSMSQYIKRIRLYMPSVDCLLDTFSYAYAWQRNDEAAYQKRKTYLQTAEQNFYFNGTEVSFLFYNLSKDTFQEIDDYIVEVVLDDRKIEELLKAQATYKNSYCVLGNTQNGQIYFSNSNNIEKYKKYFTQLPYQENNASVSTLVLGEDEYHYMNFPSQLSFSSMDMMLFLSKNSVEFVPSVVIVVFVAFLLAVLGLMIGYILYCWRLLQKPFRSLMDATYQLEQGNFEISLPYNISSDLELKLLMQRFEKMAHRLNTLINQVYRQKILMKNSELKQLQSQINPHFLYNSFFILSRMIKSEDYDNANFMLSHLSKYFEYITRSKKDLITLEKEKEHIQEYMSIQKIRFGDRFSFQLEEIPFIYQGLEIPRLSLQPIVENYFKYGMECSDNPMILKMYFLQTTDYNRIVFEDNVSTITKERLIEVNRKAWDISGDFEKTGLINVSHRIHLLFGNKSGVFMKQVSSGGIITVLQIQKERKEIDAI